MHMLLIFTHMSLYRKGLSLDVSMSRIILLTSIFVPDAISARERVSALLKSNSTKAWKRDT